MYRPDVLLRKSQKDKPAILEEKRHLSIHDRMAILHEGTATSKLRYIFRQQHYRLSWPS